MLRQYTTLRPRKRAAVSGGEFGNDINGCTVGNKDLRVIDIFWVRCNPSRVGVLIVIGGLAKFFQATPPAE
jgi:hypothetical protein